MITTQYKYILSLSGTMFFCLVFADVHAQNAREVLDLYLKAVSNGDPERWNRIKSTYSESLGSFSTGLAFQQTPDLMDAKVSRHKTYRIWPDLYLDELWEDSVLASSFYGVNKKHFMVTKGGQPLALSSGGPFEDVDEFMPVTILNALKKAKSVKLNGIVELDGKPCYEVEILTKQLNWKLFFDEETFLLNSWSNSPERDFAVLTRTFNYKDIGGLKFSMSENKSRNGVIFFWSERTLLEVDKEIDRKVFDYPAK